MALQLQDGCEGQCFWLDLCTNGWMQRSMFHEELSVCVTSFSILTKSLLPLPDKYHGQTDIDKGYRPKMELTCFAAIETVDPREFRVVPEDKEGAQLICDPFIYSCCRRTLGNFGQQQIEERLLLE